MRANEDVDVAIKDVLSKKQIKAPVIVCYDDIPKHPLKYADKAPLKPSLHIGQYKLLMNEWKFLNKYTKSLSEAVYVIYAGAAPCNHLWLLCQHFPKVKFILVDPNEFLIYMEEGTTEHINVGYSQYEHLHDYISKKKDINKYPIRYLSTDSINMYGHSNREILLADTIELIHINKDKQQHQSQIKELSRLFDNNTFDLPNYIRGSSARIFIIEDLFTNKLAERLAPLHAHFFSDIRTNISSMKGAPWHAECIKKKILPLIPGDMDLLWNLAQQSNWISILHKNTSNQPLYCMLKFRTPYMREEDKKIVRRLSHEEPFINDFIDYKKLTGESIIDEYLSGRFRYFDGVIDLQPWAGANSSETRLIFTTGGGARTFSIKTYSSDEYENRLFYYNSVLRPYQMHINNRADTKLGFDHCNDCGLTAHILDEYERKFDTKILVNWTATLNRLTGRPILNFGHGMFFNPLEWVDVTRLRAAAKYAKKK